MTKSKSVVGGILAIIGAVMTFLATIHLAVCALVKDAAETVNSSVSAGELTEPAMAYSTIVWIVGILAFVCAIIGAVFCFKNSLVGGILSAVSAAAILVLCIVVGYWAWTAIIAMALLAVGAILAFVVKKPIADKAAPAAAPTDNNTPNA